MKKQMLRITGIKNKPDIKTFIPRGLSYSGNVHVGKTFPILGKTTHIAKSIINIFGKHSYLVQYNMYEVANINEADFDFEVYQQPITAINVESEMLDRFDKYKTTVAYSPAKTYNERVYDKADKILQRIISDMEKDYDISTYEGEGNWYDRCYNDVVYRFCDFLV